MWINRSIDHCQIIENLWRIFIIRLRTPPSHVFNLYLSYVHQYKIKL